MWSSGGEENINRAYSSFSKSSSPSSPFSSSSPTKTPKRKTMEEVWKDINFPSLQDHHHNRQQVQRIPAPEPNTSYRHHYNTFRGTNLQDFLARPFSRDPPSSLANFVSTPPQPPPPPPPPPPPISLTLNSRPDEFHYYDGSREPNGPDNNSPFDAFVSSSAFPSFCNKSGSQPEENTGDRRRKRMIKNRESAARSRARKQSYTNELENQVDILTKENERLLKQQQQQLYLAAAAQLPKKCTLQRSSTAPF